MIGLEHPRGRVMRMVAKNHDEEQVRYLMLGKLLPARPLPLGLSRWSDN